MLIDLIKSYLKANQAELTERPEHVTALKRIAMAKRAQEDLIASDEKMSQGFIKITRVAQGEPVALFGADVPSHAFNRVEIFAGQDNPEGGRVPGRQLMSLLMNEQNLTELVMKPNRGEGVNWATTESVLGWRLGPFTTKLKDERHLFEDSLDSSVTQARDPLQHIVAGLKRAKLPLSAKLREDLARTIRQIDPAANIRFAQKRFLETLGKKLVKLKLEASHTLLHMDKILAAKEQLLLAPPAAEASRSLDEIQAERLSNPILNSLVELYDGVETEALREVVDWAIVEFAKRQGVDNFEPSQTDAFGKALERLIPSGLPRDQLDKFKSLGDSLSRLHNRVTNPSVLSRCEDFDPWKLSLSITHRGMDRRSMHTDFTSTGGDGVVLMINRAVSEDFFGELRVRAGSKIFEIGMSMEEFVLALRGHPEGEGVRCTFTQVAGHSIDPVPFSSRYEAELEESKEVLNAQVSEARKRAAELAKLITEGVSSKDDRDSLIADLNALNAMFNDAIDRLEVKARDGADRIETQVASHYSDTMAPLRSLLPEGGDNISFNLTDERSQEDRPGF